ncbi:HNH endonuclease [Geodermatophilus sabuli]|uniref:DUF222 domain-containing protein n=1 Tax=Geodermatophilus sabuli TaxID=1564158 RepID=A0A285EGN3_9ACTN|nr:HNH endonuclease [Geodermatophilus sabuli]MBB3085883.1 hypothetical protein [Geodermatophilus sabuli]SNX98225.1 hypothetical protein SAMN06893097_1106 [Geodermatophilus sabuli]
MGWASGPLGAVQAADREIARQTALRARVVAEFAASRPATTDRQQGERGAMSAERWTARPDVLRAVSEWAAPELSIAVNITARAAETLTDALTGALRALTDLPGLRAAAHCGAPTCRRRPLTCPHDLIGRPGLSAPGPTDGHRPGAALDRFVRARDRRCRFPGCRRRIPRGGELDHSRPWPAGPTSATDLTGYCTTDHRGRHQAPGWRHTLAPDGTLTATTPTGLTATTTPPPY